MSLDVQTGKKHALVTGSSAGIGAAIVGRLLNDGWQVTGLDRSPASISDPRFTAHELDLTQARERDDVLGQIEGVTAFVHSAGIMRGAPLGSLDPATGEMLWRIHVDAATAIANTIVPRMGSGGRVLLIGSRNARGAAGKSQYAAVKSALVGLARSWARELAPRGITVNVVSPAATETGLLGDAARAAIPPEMPPIGRFISPQEIAALVLFLLGSDAAAITGQEMVVCGGASL